MKPKSIRLSEKEKRKKKSQRRANREENFFRFLHVLPVLPCGSRIRTRKPNEHRFESVKSTLALQLPRFPLFLHHRHPAVALLPTVLRPKGSAGERRDRPLAANSWPQEGQSVVSGRVPVESRPKPRAADTSGHVLGAEMVEEVSSEVKVELSRGGGHGKGRRHWLPPRPEGLANIRRGGLGVQISRRQRGGGRRPHVERKPRYPGRRSLISSVSRVQLSPPARIRGSHRTWQLFDRQKGPTCWTVAVHRQTPGKPRQPFRGRFCFTEPAWVASDISWTGPVVEQTVRSRGTRAMTIRPVVLRECGRARCE